MDVLNGLVLQASQLPNFENLMKLYQAMGSNTTVTMGNGEVLDRIQVYTKAHIANIPTNPIQACWVLADMIVPGGTITLPDGIAYTKSSLLRMGFVTQIELDNDVNCYQYLRDNMIEEDRQNGVDISSYQTPDPRKCVVIIRGVTMNALDVAHAALRLNNSDGNSRAVKDMTRWKRMTERSKKRFKDESQF